MNYNLREIDPAFWARVKKQAAVEGRSLKAVIFLLLTAWLKGQVKL